MTGRGRPESPDKSKTRPEEIKQKQITEERQNGTTKEQKPKQQKITNHTEKKPFERTTPKKEITKQEEEKQQRAPTDNTKAPVQGAKAKTCAGRPKKTEQPTEEIKRTQPEKPKDIPKDSPKTIKDKTCAGKRKPPQQFAGEATKIQLDDPKDTTEASVPQARCADKSAVKSLLRTTLENLKIKRTERADTAEVINRIIKKIILHMKEKSECFKEVEDSLRTGSYYENLKISNPDEFDVMLPIPVDRVDIKSFGDDGAFYSVGLKRGKSPLLKFQSSSILSASEMLKEFRAEVKKSVKEFEEWEVIKKKKGCPAVTLITKVKAITISLDVVLSLKVKSSWPLFTKDGFNIQGWLGNKVKQEHKRKPYYLVPKYEGRGMVEKDGVFAKDVWRVSFSHVEKDILKNHGSEKTCCEKGAARCCRKDCLKLLKHLLSLLKEKDSTLDKFCSYHAKTTLFHACTSRSKDSDWSGSNLAHCFQLLLKDFVGHLERGVLPNFFIPTQNLLSGLGQRKCKSLADCIMKECDSGFPIFK